MKRVLHEVQREHGRHFRLLVACDANVGLAPEFFNEAGEVTGGGLQIAAHRGYASRLCWREWDGRGEQEVEGGGHQESA